MALLIGVGYSSIFAHITQVYAAEAKPLKIVRKEDEVLLPPYLWDIAGGVLNVVSEQRIDGIHRRSAKPGEWLDYGDSFSTQDQMAMYVQMNEGMQWVAGGVFEGKIASGAWIPPQPKYEISMNHGWMKVWATRSSFSGSLEIQTPNVKIILDEGILWIMVSSLKTEVYAVSGSFRVGTSTFREKQFFEWSGTPTKLQMVSNQWDLVSLEKKIGALDPNLIKLSQRSNEEWINEVSEEKFRELRVRGWRKSDRLYPKAE